MEQSKFVSEKLSLLASDVRVEPDQLDAAWVRVRGRANASSRSTRRLTWFASAAALLALGVALSTPATRAWAQSVWMSFVLDRTQPIALGWDVTTPTLLMPNVFPLAPYGESWRPATLAEAERLTGFRIPVLASPLLPHEPSFRVEEPREIRRTIDLAAIGQELASLGRSGVSAPPGLDGATIVLRPQGRFVVTSYGQCPQIKGIWRACAFVVQSRPRVLELPPGVEWESFTRFSLELAGLPSRDAARLTELARPAPTMFLPHETGSTCEAVTVRGRPALLVRYADRVAFVLQWRDGEFQYELHGRDPANAIAIAETLGAATR